MTDIVIIGGGISGLLSARELARAGAKVRLLERGELARESSWAGGGILSPLYPWRYSDPVTRLARWSQTHYPQLTEELHARSGIDPEYIRSGLLMVSEEETATARNWAEAWGYDLHAVDAATLSDLEPARQPPPRRALWMPEVAQVRNPRLVRALIEDLKRSGVELRTHTEVARILHQHGRVQGVSTQKEKIAAEQVVVCSGAWTGLLLPPPKVEIRPMRGQMLLFKAEPGIITRIMLEQNRYVIPRKDGRVLFGSTLEDTGYDKSTTEEAYKELHDIAVSRFPVLAGYPVERHWAGLRPASPKGVPYIGEHPEIRHLFFNAGHFRNGVVLAPASARLLADLLLRRTPLFDPQYYALDAAR